MRLRLVVSAGAALSACLILAACGGSSGKSASSSGASSAGSGASTAAAGACPAGKTGGTLTFGTNSQTMGFDPDVVAGNGSSGGIEMTAVYDTLMRWDSVNNKYVPEVAQSLTANSDNSVWTMVLRPNVTFGDGAALTPDLVVQNVKNMQGAARSSSVQALLIKQMDVIGTDTVKFTLTAPWGGFPYFLSHEGGMMVDTAQKAKVGAAAFNLMPTGGGVGPFEVSSFTLGTGATLTAKKNWWGGDVCLGTLKFTSIVGGAATYQAMQAGQVDAAYISDPATVHQAQTDKQNVVISGGTQDQIEINVMPGQPGADLTVRQAVAAAINPAEINTRANQGFALASSTVVGSDSGYYSAKLVGPKVDPTAAKALVQKAMGNGWDGKIALTYTQGTQDDVALAIQAQLNAVGMKATLTPLPSNTYIATVEKFSYQLALWSLNTPDADPWAKSASNLYSTSTANRTGMKDPGLDAGFDALRVASTNSAKEAALVQLQTAWNAVVPGVFYASERYGIVSKKNVGGIEVSDSGVTYFNHAYIG